jgi:uncharacterized membrane protein
MWDRSILKSNARLAISGSKYWTAYAVCVIVIFINGLFNIVINYKTDSILNFNTNYVNNDFFSYLYPYAYTYAYKQALYESRWFAIIFLLILIFAAFPLTVGLSRFFVHNRFGDTKFSTLFSSFKHGYGNSVGTMFVTNLFIFFWFFLFIIPSIIKILQYWMVPFLLSDNPNMSGSRARQLSRMMTDGEKGFIFVLFLSFFGWFFLAAIVIGIVGALCGPFSMLAAYVIITFIMVYLQATFAELYIFLRDRAIQCGMVQPEELGLTPQE